MDKEALYYKLEDYLDGKLSEKERGELQTRIATDEQVAEHLALVRMERELAGLMADDELEAKMQQWAGEADTRRRKEENRLGQDGLNGPSSKRWWLGLLFAILVLVIGYRLLSPPGPTEGEHVEEAAPLEEEPLLPAVEVPAEKPAAPSRQQPQQPVPGEKATPPPSPSQSPPVAAEKPAQPDRAQQLALAIAASTSPIRNMGTRSNGNPAAEAEEPPLEKGFRLMSEGQLAEARQTLESIPPEPRGLYLNARQYLAYIYFEQKDYETAIPVFEELTRIGYTDKDKMKWYLALAYLSAGQPAEGLPLVREVAQNEKEEAFQKAAKGLLVALDKE
ncbi:MAG: hypothetical protein KDD02_15240 [Phaeodactylibacter sp.]|nr:hypothetical protein [Phaeodactylibacter sp.]